MAISQHKIDIYPGVNDVPVAPTSLAGCNGSHLIAKYNALIDELLIELAARDARIAALESIVTPLPL